MPTPGIVVVLVIALGAATSSHARDNTRAKPPSKTAAAAPRPAATQPTTAPSEDRADIDRSTITGNRELPKVLHIVPWKKPLPGELEGRPVSSVLDEALAPLDRDVFRRRVDYDVQSRPRPAAPTP
jgi:hypothetical protein